VLELLWDELTHDEWLASSVHNPEDEARTTTPKEPRFTEKHNRLQDNRPRPRPRLRPSTHTSPQSSYRESAAGDAMTGNKKAFILDDSSQHEDSSEQLQISKSNRSLTELYRNDFVTTPPSPPSFALAIRARQASLPTAPCAPTFNARLSLRRGASIYIYISAELSGKV
jgi:hypothetical protein